jgi:hypothetical protein
MAIDVWERSESRTGDNTNRVLNYIVRGTSDDSEVIDEVLDAAPTTHDGLPLRARNPVTIEPVSVDSESEEDCLWEASVHYESVQEQRPEPRETGSKELSWQIGGGSLHIMQPVKHILHFTPGQAITNGGAIVGINSVNDGGGKIRVEGVDIPDLGGAQQITVGIMIDVDHFTAAYRKAVSLIALTTNDDTVSMNDIDGETVQYSEGELLFLGMDARWRAGDEDVSAQFQFAVRENVADACSSWDNADRPAAQAAVAKKGWEYMWCQYGTKKLTIGAKDVMVPAVKFVSIDQVFRAADFSFLNPSTWS